MRFTQAFLIESNAFYEGLVSPKSAANALSNGLKEELSIEALLNHATHMATEYQVIKF